ncbi:LysE family translocator [Paenibacillus sp. GCM10012306]|uniref:LysE family translocator n=1 Tax=Paenibacillus sp. GCM10012306 TaxID=3317342 RepID=UPI00361E5AC5
MDTTSFLIYCVIATFTPGPTNIVILSTVNHFGAKKAMKYSYGATVGFGLLLVVSAVLNNLLLTILPKVLMIMQVIGSLYMLYLAYLICKKSSSDKTENQAATFWSGFMMQLLNPKSVLFTLTVIPTFVLPYYSGAPAIMLSVMEITLVGFLAFITWVLFGTIFKEFLQKHDKIVSVMMAIFLVYAGIMIWI